MERSAKNAERLPPSVREHGTEGTTEDAVGGFGEGYSAQVAHGGESNEPSSPSHSERAQNAPAEEDASLAHAVQKSIARAHIDSADLAVSVHDSVVRLRGTVRHLYEKSELEARARAVAGVDSLISEVTVLADGRS